jgi:hypothetical protein
VNGADADASSSARTAWWSCAAVIAVCLLVGLPTIRSDNYFLGDDFGLVQHLHDLRFGRLLSYFASDWTEGIYGYQLDELRPLLALSYWLDAHLFGANNVSGYHATNLILHLVNALLVLAIARSVAPRQPAFAALAASLFALMPSHAEPVAWISGRVDSLAALFYLAAFLCFVRFRLAGRSLWLGGVVALFVCGLFAKQSVVTFPLLVFAFDLFWPASDNEARGWSLARAWPHVLLFALAASYLALRHALFGNAVREDLLTADTIKQFIFRQDSYARELMPTPNRAAKPFKLLAEWVTGLTLAVCLGWILARRQAYAPAIRRICFFGVAWYAITIAPMIVTYLSARHLYITTAGLSIAVASLLLPGAAKEEHRRTTIRMAMAATLIVFYAVASVWNVSEWVAGGAESQRFASAVPRLLRSVPRGSIVFVSVPEWHGAGWFWSWATPFALQPPFTSEDLYASYRIVERPPVYCCPPDQWWAARKGTVTAVLNSPAPQHVVSIEFAPEEVAGAKLTTRMVDGQALKRRIESALGKPIDSTTETMTATEVEEVGRALFE